MPLQPCCRFLFAFLTLLALACGMISGCGASNEPKLRLETVVAADEQGEKGEVKETETSETPMDAATTPNEPAAPAEEKNPPANEANPDDEQKDDAPPAVANDKPPFLRTVPIDDFPRDAEWLNTNGPLSKKDLKGKFVLLDFWTYCCINCMHILPELKKLEHAYPNNLVVIGVHSAKFEGEKDSENIAGAVLRYEIEHPVVNDADHKIWDSLGVNSWPTILMLDPEGNAVWGRSGEFKAEEVDAILKRALPYYRKKELLDEKPLQFNQLAQKQKATPLRFPGKVLADEKSGRLFIADSNHNRIVVTSLEGKLQAIIGSGEIGRADGDFASSSFNHPQGMALLEETLYVCDTENHMLRKVDLKKQQVKTLAGVGEQARSAWPGMDEKTTRDNLPDRWVGKPATTALNSPWDLSIHKTDLYIAMAGPHQIWKMPLDESEIGPFAGNGREDIVDGPLLPQIPYETGFSSFAQPSGLSSDGEWLYVADSEGSSVRAVPFDTSKNVFTVIGTAKLPYGRLFHFGDKDGSAKEALLQHALGVAYHEKKIFVADTYNNKIKVVDAESGDTITLAGSGEPGTSDEPAQFDEPAGISIAGGKLYIADTNNHLIRVVDPTNGKVTTLTIVGLAPPGAAAAQAVGANPTTKPATETSPTSAKEKRPNFKNAAKVNAPATAVKPTDNKITLAVELVLPSGWKVNPEAPMSYWLDAKAETGPCDRASLGKRKLEKPVTSFDVSIPVTGTGKDEISVSMTYYYCQAGDNGVCKMNSVVFTVPLSVGPDGSTKSIPLKFNVPE